MKKEKLVVFYDGECGFCNKSVQFILKNASTKDVFFSSLQSDFSIKFFHDHHFPQPDLSTFYYFEEGSIYSKSTAVLKIVPKLKWYFQFLWIGYLIPRILRDKLYDAIAKRRNKLAPGFCAMPTAEERKRFLN